MNRILIVALALISFTLTGCTGLIGVAEQLKGDAAVIRLDVVTLYGTGKLIRVGNNTNSVTISPDGTVNINPRKAE